GMVMRLPERDSYSYHRDKMYANLAVAMGGRVAEEVIFGYDKVSSGASGDIQSATQLARAMVTQWGMSDEVGPLDYGESDEGYLGYSMNRGPSMSNQTAQLIDSEVKKLVEGGLGRARKLLTDHIDQLHKLAGALLDYETLSGDEIKRLIAGEDIGRPDPGAAGPAIPAVGGSVPKTRRPSGPFGSPTPQGA
ncbi:MAG: cell division protein FtsH, partial [Sphingomonas sp.]|nr:cell division protein FtsH [Sphingomonas sp.]